MTRIISATWGFYEYETVGLMPYGLTFCLQPSMEQNENRTPRPIWYNTCQLRHIPDLSFGTFNIYIYIPASVEIELVHLEILSTPEGIWGSQGSHVVSTVTCSALLKSQTLSIKFWLTLLQLSVDWKLPNWKWTWSISSVLAILLVKLKLFHPFWFFFIYFIMTGKAILSYINATPGKISINVTFHLLAHDCHMPDPSNSLCTIVYCISTGRDKVLLS